MNFNGILVGSDDPKRLTDYYRKLLGEPAYDDGGYTTWMSPRTAGRWVARS